MAVIPWIDWSIEAYWMGRPWEVLWGINECTVQFYPLWYVITVSLLPPIDDWLQAASNLWRYFEQWMDESKSIEVIQIFVQTIGAIHQVRCFYYLCYTLMETLMYVNTSFCRRSALRIRAQRAICLSDWVPWESYYLGWFLTLVLTHWKTLSGSSILLTPTNSKKSYRLPVEFCPRDEKSHAWESYYAWVVSNVGVNSLKNVKW